MDARQVFRQGKWWYHQPDGAWLVWDETTMHWSPAPGAPPPESLPRTYRAFRGHRLWAMSLLGVVIVTDAVAVLFDLGEYSLLRRIASGAEVTPAEANASDLRQESMGTLQLSLFLVTGIAFIAWFHRSYSNIAALAPERTRYRTGWAIGGWFVPILNFFRPKQIANDIWRGTTWPPESKPVSPLLNWWWGFWLGSEQLGWFLFRGCIEAEAIDELTTCSRFTIAADATSVVAGMLALLVVLKLSRRIHERAKESGVDAGTF